MRLGFPNVSLKVEPCHRALTPAVEAVVGDGRVSLKLVAIQIVSFWGVRKGMRGVGGRWNALRHRHDRRRSSCKNRHKGLCPHRGRRDACPAFPPQSEPWR